MSSTNRCRPDIARSCLEGCAGGGGLMLSRRRFGGRSVGPDTRVDGRAGGATRFVDGRAGAGPDVPRVRGGREAQPAQAR